jgi:hypothetical protein
MGKTFITRAYNNIVLSTKTGTITKYSTEIKLRKEGEYYSLLPWDLNFFFPRKVSSGTLQDRHSLTLEYFGYPNLGQLMMGHKTLCEVPWEKIAKNIAHVIFRFSEHKSNTPNRDKCRTSMFIEKTEREYKNLIDNFQEFKVLSEKETLMINGREYSNFNTLWESAKLKIEKLCHNDLFTVIHGDMCFSNILCDPLTGIVRLIDPRGSFGNDGVYGDSIYDAAKLLHSIEGKYEFIIYDKYKINYDVNEAVIDYKFDEHQDLSELKALMLQGFDENYIRLVMSTIFIGMCARHYDSLDRQIIMYCTGIKAMTEALECIS